MSLAWTARSPRIPGTPSSAILSSPFPPNPTHKWMHVGGLQHQRWPSLFSERLKGEASTCLSQLQGLAETRFKIQVSEDPLASCPLSPQAVLPTPQMLSGHCGRHKGNTVEGESRGDPGVASEGDGHSELRPQNSVLGPSGHPHFCP